MDAPSGAASWDSDDTAGGLRHCPTSVDGSSRIVTPPMGALHKGLDFSWFPSFFVRGFEFETLEVSVGVFRA